MPTGNAPWLAPPESTNAERGRFARRPPYLRGLYIPKAPTGCRGPRVAGAGFEPATFGLLSRRATHYAGVRPLATRTKSRTFAKLSIRSTARTIARILRRDRIPSAPV